jgi:hypothetical protein
MLSKAAFSLEKASSEALAQALLTVISQDAHGWFKHCGYLLFDERKRENGSIFLATAVAVLC